MHHVRTRPLARRAAAGLVAVAALALTACGEEDTAGPETGIDVEDVQEEADEDDAALEPYDGPYDTAFADDVDSYVGQEVTVSADVNEVLSTSSFTIAGTDDTDVEELLVVGATEVSGLEPDLAVAVTGTVQEAFDLPAVEDELGVDLDDDLYTSWEEEPYLVAESVDTSVASDQ